MERILAKGYYTPVKVWCKANRRTYVELEEMLQLKYEDNSYKIIAKKPRSLHYLV